MNVQEYLAKKMLPREALAKKVHELRAASKTIATLNGSFDLLHAGHLHMIFEASKQADVLIVALNSDASIKQYKSPDRPIIPLKDRMSMMAALGFVTYVTSFDETDPRALLEQIRPDVHVNGSEYGHNCIEAPVVKSAGGRIHIVDLIPGLSTTNILEKIKQCV
ncbi:MAG: adenylyltransferase/cytidyltransferase family protein [Chlamydiia bacterium]|nr:adenylyltransferase/cytidyltransferase family protein [Chlamydiia bacterium]MCP5509273.1 adenylyltransferase/cytidyltransferase family protein [Chlamydiales bacterium]